MDFFPQQCRRDSVLLAHVGFNVSRYKFAAKALQEGDNHVRVILTGAAKSSALYQVIHDGHTKVGCEWCHGEDVVSSWHHLGWECAFFAAMRPACGGIDLLQRRLGWPGRSASDAAALRHLAAIRSVVSAAAPHRLSPGVEEEEEEEDC